MVCPYIETCHNRKIGDVSLSICRRHFEKCTLFQDLLIDESEEEENERYEDRIEQEDVD